MDGKYFLYVIVISASLGPARCTDCRSIWASTLDILVSGGQLQYKNTIMPFLLATKTTYTWDIEDKILGWTLIKTRKPVYGMHALAYRSITEYKKVMVAVRGYSLGGATIDSQADLCAGRYILRDEDQFQFCNNFNAREIDYLQHLREFIYELYSDLGIGVCLALTGHSLGGTVASLTSVSLPSGIPPPPAIVFASSGERAVAKRLGFETNFGNIYNTFAEYDPSVILPDSYTNQTGTGCKLSVNHKPHNCELCMDNPNFDIMHLNTSCGSCFLEMNTYSLYINSILKDNERPTCAIFVKPSSSESHQVRVTFLPLLATIIGTILT